jgi:hypothetical protein
MTSAAPNSSASVTKREDRLGAGRLHDSGPLPDGVVTTVHQLTTHDGALVSGTLFTVGDARTVVTISHPRVDSTHHVLIPLLCRAGLSVWAQGMRGAGSDLTLVHEQAVLDIAAGFAFLRRRGFEHVVPLGHSGGGALNALYIQQASRTPAHRLTATPSGRPVDLPGAELPMPDAIAFVAPHPGQGDLLLGCIDPSVTDDDDPLSIDPALDLYDPANGFVEPPASSHFSDDFLRRYREAQRQRVQRLDERARDWVADANAARSRFRKAGDRADRRRSIAPRLMTVYRTDADPRCVDLTIDPSERPYGSVFGRQPDIINYGVVGFGRLTTPDAWLSTWSGLSTNASMRQCGPDVRVPTLLVEFSGDQATFPAVTAEIHARLGGDDKEWRKVRGLHFGGPIATGEPSGAELAAAVVVPWIESRFL